MKLNKYTITSIDTDKQTISFNLEFDDNTNKDFTVSYKDVAYDLISMDKKGNPISVLAYRPAFDVKNKKILMGQIESYASAYIGGLETTKGISLASEVNSIVGEKIKANDN